MTEKGMENNKVTVIGTIVSGFTFSHAVFGEGFYLVDLLVNRFVSCLFRFLSTEIPDFFGISA